MSSPEHPKISFSSIETKNPREAAYLALLTAIREESFVSKKLEAWKKKCQPADNDFHLAKEIVYGTTRMALALDYIAEQLTEKQKLNLKLREKVLLRTAVYQQYYMDRIPPYAVVNETIDIAKKYCHETSVKFLNAILRRLTEEAPKLPEGNTVPELGIRYSYPTFFVQELIQNFGSEKAVTIMEAGNRPSQTMFRVRPNAHEEMIKQEGIELLAGTHSPIGVVRDPQLIPQIAKSPDYYIQNITPNILIQTLSQNVKIPKRILDLCASPGGKLLAVHDQFPDAELYANDVTAEKLTPLSENCAKYGLSVNLTCSRGEDYQAEEPFDLIILDVPCSNSGVLNKRPEARWRISQKVLEQLEQLQLQLLRHAVSLLSDDGEIWYMTCSVLKRENTRLVDKACDLLPLQVRTKEIILPNLDGWDGGFGCALRKL